MEWTAVAVLVYSRKKSNKKTPLNLLETLKKSWKSNSNSSGLVRALLNADVSLQNLEVHLLAAIVCVFFCFVFSA